MLIDLMKVMPLLLALLATHVDAQTQSQKQLPNQNSQQVLKQLNLGELPAVLQRPGAEVLSSLGVTSTLAERALTHPDFKGMLGEFSLIHRLGEPWNHDALLQESDFLGVLGKALAAGAITGYDLRSRDVYAQFPTGRTFIYSHGSTRHLQQLASVLSVHDVNAAV